MARMPTRRGTDLRTLRQSTPSANSVELGVLAPWQLTRLKRCPNTALAAFTHHREELGGMCDADRRTGSVETQLYRCPNFTHATAAIPLTRRFAQALPSGSLSDEEGAKENGRLSAGR